MDDAMARLLSLFQSDQQLVELIRKGDEQVLSLLYRKNLHLITKYIQANNGNEYDASELLQDALVVLWEKIRRNEFTLESKLSTFLYAVVKKKWLQELVRRRRYTTLEQVENNPGPEQDAMEQIQDKERVTMVRKCLDMLSPLCQKILILYYYEEKSMTEIATLTGLANEDVAKSKKYQCKKDLEVLIKSLWQ
jgi:RNA polymerase sigma factor (sigma-70 family)